MSSRGISLSRLAITGAITQSTPLVVIKEIADSHSIGYEEENMTNQRYLAHLINTINTKNVNVVKKPYDMNDYRLIARFVNSKHKWKKHSLTEAFEFLIEYTRIEKLCEIDLEFSYGPQTPEYPYRLNASVLYGICNANRIDTRFDSTLEEMASNIKLLFSLRSPDIIHTVKKNIQDALMYGGCGGYQLVNILSQINRDEGCRIMMDHNNNNNNNIFSGDDRMLEAGITYENLNNAAGEIRLRNVRTKPRTHAEAVAMAAIYYKMDISKVQNPLAEYQELIRTPFFPFHKELARRIQTANQYPDSIENPRLDQVFNPNLPSSMYEEEDLETMCFEEGYKNDDLLDSTFELLQISYLQLTFLHGKQGNIVNRETTDLEDIDELEYDNIVVYGVRGYDMRAYTYGELRESFKHYNRFQNPADDNGLFLESAVNKLFVLCRKYQRATESDEIFDERLLLEYEMGRVKLYQQTNQAQVTEFIERYRSYSNSDREKIHNFLNRLLHSSMYMRGWIGEGPYPLSTDDASHSSEEYPSILVRVTESLVELDHSIGDLDQLDEIGELVKNLPLIFFNNNSDELLPSTNQEEGLTIYERINIVRGGEDGSLQSCIRMSSNRFAASAYYYMRLLGMDLPFNISDLAHLY